MSTEIIGSTNIVSTTTATYIFAPRFSSRLGSCAAICLLRVGGIKVRYQRYVKRKAQHGATSICEPTGIFEPDRHPASISSRVNSSGMLSIG